MATIDDFSHSCCGHHSCEREKAAAIEAAHQAGYRECQRDALKAAENAPASGGFLAIHQAIHDLKPARPVSPGGVEAGPTRDQQLLQDINDRIMWMAEQYAEAGGSRGPEMEAYREINARLGAALARVKP